MIDIDHLRTWTGRTEEAQDIATPRLLAEFRATLSPNLFDPDAQAAPPAFHWCLTPPVSHIGAVGGDGHAAKGGFLPPVPLPRRMWAGGELEILDALREGETVIRRSRIGDIAYKEGRTGPLCFVAVHHEIETPRGLAVRERHDIVYRDGTLRPAAPAEPPPARQCDLNWSIEASTLLLFRYSALTFNGHRIHYDHPYATGVEGYAGLVVHGPIQATLLVNIASVLAGRPPARFTYRGVSPLTAGGSFTVSARRDGDSIACWAAAPDGRITMEGQALVA